MESRVRHGITAFLLLRAALFFYHPAAGAGIFHGRGPLQRRIKKGHTFVHPFQGGLMNTRSTNDE